MKKSSKKAPKLEDLIPDAERRQEILGRMYKGDKLLGEKGIFTDLLQAMVNAALEGEMDHHLSEEFSKGHKNRRNGKKKKDVRSTAGPLEISTPRDRLGNHEPILIKNWERELGTGMDDVIISLYAKGQSVEDVRYQLRQIYGVELSSGAISMVTNKVWDSVLTWQQRPLNSCYPIVYLDAIHYKVRDNGQIVTKAIYTCYGVDAEGNRDVLGLYLGGSEGASQWGLILEDLKKRGVEEVFFFCVDGLKGFADAILEVFPSAIVQRCIVHMIRTSTRFVADKDKKAVCRDLRKIYTAANREQALLALETFGNSWDKKYKEIRPKWEQDWEHLMAFMDYGANIRRMIYTTNPVEALHRIMRKVTKTKGAWTSDKALLKQLYLAIHHSEGSWKRKAFSWTSIQRELMEKFGERYLQHL